MRTPVWVSCLAEPAAIKALVQAGFASLADIAEVSRESVVGQLDGVMGRQQAAALHAAATLQSRYLANVMTADRVDPSGGAAISPLAASTGLGEVCGCPSCNDATSPLAYLADLLDYAVKHVAKITTIHGLQGNYFDGTAFPPDDHQLRLTRADAVIDFDWHAGSPDPSLQSGAFSVRWTGKLKPRYSEWYTLHIAADSGVLGVSLFVDGQLVVDGRSCSNDDTTERSGQIRLTAGRRHAVRLDYAAKGATAKVSLLWSSPSQAKEVIPQGQLCASQATQAIDLDFLSNAFHQPFGNLPAACEQLDDQIRQARLCVEVLRAALAADGGSTPQWYPGTVYTVLLDQVGTSFDEIRSARSARKHEREALAGRLGFALDPARRYPFDPTQPDQLDRLLIEPGALDEQSLEDIFGLRATTRDPLAPTPPAELLGWRLTHLEDDYRAEDRAATPPLGEQPIIDPDIIGYPDLRDPSPAATSRASRPKTAWKPVDFLDDRLAWVADRTDEIRTYREHPDGGFKVLITDEMWSALNNRWIRLNVGLGISVDQFNQLHADRRNGKDISASLAA